MHFLSNGRRVGRGKAMKAARDSRYVLAPGTQVREDDFGLFFDLERIFFLKGDYFHWQEKSDSERPTSHNAG